MTFANYGGYVAYQKADVSDDEPISTHMGRILSENARYFVDSAGQVRIKWMSLASGANRRLTILRNSPTAKEFYPIFQATIPMRMHPTNGTTYPLRCRIGAVNDKVSADSYIRVVVGSRATIDDIMTRDSDTTPGGDHVVQYTVTTGGTPAPYWINTGFLLTPTTYDARRQVTNVQTLTAPSGGSTINVQWCLMNFEIWGAQDATDLINPEISAIVAEEFVGA